jgi:malonyl-CoA/methylmalonyl-CoA synthetase
VSNCSNLYSAFAAANATDSQRPAVDSPSGAQWTWAEVDRESSRVAAWLARQGLVKGDRLSIQAGKSPFWLWVYLACLRSGVVVHPLSEDYQREELRYLLTDAAPALVICDPAREAEIAGLVPPRCGVVTLNSEGGGRLPRAVADLPQGMAPPTAATTGADGAVLLYSSGTTGRPKGALLSHGNLLANGSALVQAWGFHREDVLLHTLPVHHAHGLLVGLGCVFLAGARLRFMPRFTADDTLRELPRATVYMGVPTHYTRLLRHPGLDARACSSLRLFVSGSAPLPPATWDAFRQRTGHEILERYGMTETGMNCSNPLAGPRRPGSVGPALHGVEVRVVDGADDPVATDVVGEIQVRGANVFAGYWRRPEATAESFTTDGWFRTGDQGAMDADGYLWIVGRSKDLIISGGLNVYPREVELVLEALPLVAEAAVIGVPHPDFGEAVVAVVVVSDEHQGNLDASAREDEIRAGLPGQLAAFKRPKRVFFAPALPRNTMGKVQKNLLRATYASTFLPA